MTDKRRDETAGGAGVGTSSEGSEAPKLETCRGLGAAAIVTVPLWALSSAPAYSPPVAYAPPPTYAPPPHQ